ncbi:hypothetical protein [Corynebacterium striatum]
MHPQAVAQQRYDERAEVISGWVGHPALVDATPLLHEVRVLL